MKIASLVSSLALAGVLAFPCMARAGTVTDPSAPRALQSQGPVQVEWQDPAGFSEIRYSRNRYEARRGDWVRQLAEHLREQAVETLRPGERLEVLITDIERAGQYEPFGATMRDVRVVRDVYPPRMDLSFVLRGADGEILEQGTRNLRDLGFLSSIPRSPYDPLSFEKRMIDDWVRREFGAASDRIGQR